MISNTTEESTKAFDPSHLKRLPHALELTVLFRELVHFWTGLRTEIPTSDSPQSPEDPIEFATRWNGSVKGTLVLRASRRLAESLKWVFEDKEKKAAGGNALLQEMTTLYSIFLVRYAWMDELFEMGPILARPSKPEFWPSTAPHAFCAVRVAGEPVEIRLWMDAPAGASETHGGERTTE